MKKSFLFELLASGFMFAAGSPIELPAQNDTLITRAGAQTCSFHTMVWQRCNAGNLESYATIKHIHADGYAITHPNNGEQKALNDYWGTTVKGVLFTVKMVNNKLQYWYAGGQYECKWTAGGDSQCGSRAGCYVGDWTRSDSGMDCGPNHPHLDQSRTQDMDCWFDC